MATVSNLDLHSIQKMKNIEYGDTVQENNLVLTDGETFPYTKWLIPDLVRSFKYIGCKIGHCDPPPKKEKPAPAPA